MRKNLLTLKFYLLKLTEELTLESNSIHITRINEMKLALCT